MDVIEFLFYLAIECKIKCNHDYTKNKSKYLKVKAFTKKKSMNYKFYL